MKTILAHHSADDREYGSLIHNLYDYATSFKITINNLHNNLFDIYHKTKPDAVILSTSDYSQEFHDFISEYGKSTKIIVIMNSDIKNKQILEFFHNYSVWLVGKKDYILNDMHYDKSLLYDKLYNSKIYKYEHQNRIDKIAVLLSSQDDLNAKFLDKILYPHTKEKLCLFNSNTYIHPQNMGHLSMLDINIVLNTFSKLIDIDDAYRIESQICNIDNIEVSENLLDNIHNNIIKSKINDIETLSYKYFIDNHLLKII